MTDPLGRVRHSPRSGRAASGFTYLLVMFLVALLGITAAVAGTTWRFVAQRDREEELLFVGRQFRNAIESYRQAHAGQLQPLPTELSQLLGQSNQLLHRRFLRRLYIDPITGSSEWGLLKSPQGGIAGVFSLSSARPVRVLALSSGSSDGIDFAKASSYRDWVFAVAFPRPPTGAGGAAANGSAASSDDPAAQELNNNGAPPATWPGGVAPVGD